MRNMLLAIWWLCIFALIGPVFAGLEEGMFCPEVYQPVCGLVEVECVTAPCDPVPETFSNMCYLQNDARQTRYLYNGECADRQVAVAKLVHDQIGEISPVDPVLGGSRYVVELDFLADERVTVTYEDGHIQEAFTASYSIEDGTVDFTIESITTGSESDQPDTPLEGTGETVEPPVTWDQQQDDTTDRSDVWTWRSRRFTRCWQGVTSRFQQLFQ